MKMRSGGVSVCAMASVLFVCSPVAEATQQPYVIEAQSDVDGGLLERLLQPVCYEWSMETCCWIRFNYEVCDNGTICFDIRTSGQSVDVWTAGDRCYDGADSACREFVDGEQVGSCQYQDRYCEPGGGCVMGTIKTQVCNQPDLIACPL